MNVLITGGTGFIGCNLAQHYMKDHTVLLTGNQKENDLDCLSYEFHNIDWAAIPKIDIVFHQAAITDTMIHDRDMMMRVNFWESRQLIDGAIKAGVKKIVYASSAAVYGDNVAPFKEADAHKCLNVYGESKLLLDRYCEIVSASRPDVSIIGLRYSNVYGPGEVHKQHARSMVLQLYQQMTVGSPKLFEWGEQKRDFVYIKDVVQANVRAAESNTSGVFNVGSGSPVSFNRIVEILNNYVPAPRTVEYIPNNIATFYQNHTELDLTKANKELGYNPQYSIENGIKDYVEYLK